MPPRTIRSSYGSHWVISRYTGTNWPTNWPMRLPHSHHLPPDLILLRLIACVRIGNLIVEGKIGKRTSRGWYALTDTIDTSTKITKIFKEFGDQREGRYTQCITGMGYTGEFYHHSTINESNHCLCNGHTPQTRTHLITSCSKYEQHCQKHLQGENYHESSHSNSYSLCFMAKSIIRIPKSTKHIHQV
jgi:hypothetical protein